jgi:hypothetical protein
MVRLRLRLTAGTHRPRYRIAAARNGRAKAVLPATAGARADRPRVLAARARAREPGDRRGRGRRLTGAQRATQRRLLACASASLGDPLSLGKDWSLRERFDAGTGLVALGAVVLLVSLFVDWYSPSGDAWAVFEVVDVLLAAAAATALAAIVPRYAGLQRALPAIAFGALFVVVVQIVDAPPSARGDEIESGAWLALAATALMAAGATLSAASISVTVDVRGRDRRRRSAAIDAREREREEAAAAAEEHAEARRARRRPADATAGATAAGAEPTAATEPVAVEDADEAGLWRRGGSTAGAPAPHAGDPPAAPPEGDPDRTQALDPVDRPGEGGA